MQATYQRWYSVFRTAAGAGCREEHRVAKKEDHHTQCGQARSLDTQCTADMQFSELLAVRAPGAPHAPAVSLSLVGESLKFSRERRGHRESSYALCLVRALAFRRFHF